MKLIVHVYALYFNEVTFQWTFSNFNLFVLTFENSLIYWCSPLTNTLIYLCSPFIFLSFSNVLVLSYDIQYIIHSTCIGAHLWHTLYVHSDVSVLTYYLLRWCWSPAGSWCTLGRGGRCCPTSPSSSTPAQHTRIPQTTTVSLKKWLKIY